MEDRVVATAAALTTARIGALIGISCALHRAYRRRRGPPPASPAAVKGAQLRAAFDVGSGATKMEVGGCPSS